MPGLTATTRTLGAHSIARDCTKLRMPALAAPYAAVPGEGRRALTLPTKTTTPAPWACIIALAFCARCRGASRFRRKMDSWKRGEAFSAST